MKLIAVTPLRSAIPLPCSANSHKLPYKRFGVRFIKTGIGPKKIIDEEQVMTFMRWGYKMTADNAPELLKAMSGDYVKDREFISDNLDKITKSLPNGFYDAIAVDEVQDLAGTELKL